MAGNPLQSLAPLSGNAQLQAAKAIVNQTYGAPLSELAHQIAVNDRQGAGAQKLTAGYFNQLGGLAQQGLASEGQIASDLNSQLGTIGQQTQDRLGALGQQDQAGMGTYSPGMNAGAGSQALASEIARQQGLAAQSSGAFRNFGATQGANYRGMAASNLGTFGLMGQERLGQIGQATRLADEPLTSKIAALQGTRGSALEKTLGSLRQQEITNRITEAGLGIKQQSLAAQIQNQRANQGLAAARIKATIRGQDVTLSLGQARNRIAQINSKIASGRLTEQQRHNLAGEKIAWQRALNQHNTTANGLPKRTPTGTATLTPVQQNRYFQQLDSLPNLIKQMQQGLPPNVATKLGLPAGTKLTAAQIRGYLTSGNNPSRIRYDPRLIDAGYALAGWGYLTPRQITELNKLGLIVGNRYKRGKAPIASPQSGFSRGPAAGNLG